MGIVPKFNLTQVEKMLKETAERLDASIIRALRFLGEECVNEARANGSYKDQTSNLRNSIGYAIIANGRLVDGEYGNARDGLKQSRQIVNEVSTSYPAGYVLTVIAGMNYAVYVESKGYNVLTTAELHAETKVKEMLDKILKQ